MSSTFNLLTAGGARFNRKYQKDIDLFSTVPKNKGKAKAEPATNLPHSLDFFNTHPTAPSNKKRRPTIQDDSDSESSTSSIAPPTQKITVSGPEPLPRSLHTNLPSLLSHPDCATTSRAGETLLRALKIAGISSLWGVQCAVSGSLLSGNDTLCIAPTGSGKTLAYLLPTLVKLGDPARDMKGKAEGRGVRCLIVVPTYDLAVQIAGVIKAITSGRRWRCLILSKATEKAVCEASPGLMSSANGKGGLGQADAAERDDGADNEDEHAGSDDEDDDQSTGSVDEFGGDIPLGLDFLVATPERLHHLLDEGRISLAHTRHLILDEVDRLLSSDFLPQTRPIIEACETAQKCMCSATIPAGSEEIARKYLDDGGVRIVVGVKDSATTTVSQSLLYTATEAGKLLALRNLISSGSLPYPTLLFCQSISRATDLHAALLLDNLKVGLIHSDLSKASREENISNFRTGQVWILVVTEVLARGMDFRGVKVVVNFDFPQSVQSYIHRIGRTGRAGRPGKAITFFGDEDGPYLRTIANVLLASGCPVPDYMLSLQKPSKNLKRQLARVPVKRKDVGGGGRDVAKEQGRRKKGIVEGSKRRKMKNQTGKAVPERVQIDMQE